MSEILYNRHHLENYVKAQKELHVKQFKEQFD